MTFLENARLVLAIGGLLFLVAGIATESRVIVWAAIILLGAALVVRLYLRKRRDSGSN